MTFGEIFQKALSSIDFFPLMPSERITYGKCDSYSNTTTKGMSIVLILLSILSFFYFGENMIYRRNPDIKYSDFYDTTSNLIDLKEENFFFSVGLYQNEHYVYDESVYIPKIWLTIQSNESIIDIPIPLGRCKDENIPKNIDLAEYFKSNHIYQMYCIQNYSNIEFQVGTFDSSVSKSLKVRISICDSNNDSLLCQNEEKINEIIKNSQIVYIFTYCAVDSSNYENPFYLVGTTTEIPISNNTITNTVTYFQTIEMETDDGYLTNNPTTSKSLTKMSDRILILPKNEEKQLLVDSTLKLDKITKRYLRKYEKLQSVIAQTGGTIKIMIMVLFFLIKPIATLGFYQDLCNDIFTYEIIAKTIRPKNENSTVRHPRRQVIVEEIDKDLKNKSKKRAKLKLNFFQYMWSFIRPNSFANFQRKHIDAANELLNKNLDIAHIINKLVEIEKLKFILFDKTQLTVFEYMPKPVITFRPALPRIRESRNKSLFSSNSFLWNETFLQKAFHGTSPLDRAHEILKNKESKSEIDFKLINCIEELNANSEKIITDVRKNKDGSNHFFYKKKTFSEKLVNFLTGE